VAAAPSSVAVGTAPPTTAPVAASYQKETPGVEVEDDSNRATWAEGLVVPPPFLDPEVAEDDVLLATDSQIDTFDDTLSTADAEEFLSLLTTPFLRCPLILGFFAGGRAGALFNARLRNVLEAVVFEPQCCIPPRSTALKGIYPTTPLITGVEASVHAWFSTLVSDTSLHSVPVLPAHRRQLGTPQGVLLSELQVSQPVRRSSLHTGNAHLICSVSHTVELS
jgi:hypothetical protein